MIGKEGLVFIKPTSNLTFTFKSSCIFLKPESDSRILRKHKNSLRHQIHFPDVLSALFDPNVCVILSQSRYFSPHAGSLLTLLYLYSVFYLRGAPSSQFRGWLADTSHPRPTLTPPSWQTPEAWQGPPWAEREVKVPACLDYKLYRPLYARAIFWVKILCIIAFSLTKRTISSISTLTMPLLSLIVQLSRDYFGFPSPH